MTSNVKLNKKEISTLCLIAGPGGDLEGMYEAIEECRRVGMMPIVIPLSPKQTESIKDELGIYEYEKKIKKILDVCGNVMIFGYPTEIDKHLFDTICLSMDKKIRLHHSSRNVRNAWYDDKGGITTMLREHLEHWKQRYSKKSKDK